MYEIERKFLVDITKIKLNNPIKIVQAYFPIDNDKCVVRVRLTEFKNKKESFITIKGKNKGISRSEFEYKIPYENGLYMIENFCIETIQKERYVKRYKGFKWEIDIFKGKNEGLCLAEIELKSIDEKFDIPSWVIKEVSSENKYFNNNLLKNPYENWKK